MALSAAKVLALRAVPDLRHEKKADLGGQPLCIVYRVIVYRAFIYRVSVYRACTYRQLLIPILFVPSGIGQLP